MRRVVRLLRAQCRLLEVRQVKAVHGGDSFNGL